MAMFSGPTEHAANPPETWQVVKAGDRLWQLTTEGGTVLGTYGTRTHAKQATTEGQWFDMWHAERRWYAGDTPDGWTPWETVRAEQADTITRVLDKPRARMQDTIDRHLSFLRADHRALTGDPDTPEDLVAWARAYLDATPALENGHARARLVKSVSMIEGCRAEIARIDDLAADYAPAAEVAA